MTEGVDNVVARLYDLETRAGRLAEENADLLIYAEKAGRERDALLGLLVQKSACSFPPDLYDALLPDSCSPLGFAWTQDLSYAEAVAAIRAAAGLPPEPAP